MTFTPKKGWTRPYYGVTHLGRLRDFRRVTVVEYEGFSYLRMYTRHDRENREFKGKTFRGKNHLTRAKNYGAKWIKETS